MDSLLQGRKFLIVGAGFYGAVMAQQLASVLNQKVLVIDKRSHIGGNSYSTQDAETGIEVHQYGSHIFHTSDEKTWNYINRFTKFNHYRHKVLTQFQGKTFTMPINLQTINHFFNRNLTPQEARELVAQEIQRENIKSPRNLEEKAISLIGRSLYEAFIKGYTIKQWDKDPRELPESIITRLPVRYFYDFSYFDDIWQGIPLDGYGKLFERLLQHPNIEIKLNTDFFAFKDSLPEDCFVIYSGPIDRYFNYAFGELNWRTLDFQKEVHQVGDYQGTTVMNYAEATVPYTRIHEFRHYHPERQFYPSNKTVIFKEFSKKAGREDTPYYPVNTSQDQERLQLYQAQAQNLKRVHFGGRLGSYKYYDMHQVIAQALAHFAKLQSSSLWNECLR